MTLSRPLQVAIAVVGLAAVVWFFALRGHSSSSESTASPPVPAASSSPSTASSSGGSSSSGSVYHGSAPGVEGLTRAIQKAHGAVTQSEQNATRLAQKSAQASGESAATATGGTAASAGTTHSSATKTAPSAVKAPAHALSSTSTGAAHKTAASRAGGLPAGQVWVEHELALKPAPTVALLFFNPHGADDVRTLQELRTLLGPEHVVLRVAAAGEVGTYGTFTRVASIYQTPTLLFVRPGGQVSQPITGLIDAFSIEQAIDEPIHR